MLFNPKVGHFLALVSAVVKENHVHGKTSEEEESGTRKNKEQASRLEIIYFEPAAMVGNDLNLLA